MTLAHYTAHTPQLVQALQALGQRADKQAADILFDELCGITQLVAKKFTNDRTAEGLQEAYRLTIGCLSLAISQADIADSGDAKLSFLLQHGAEHVFQMGFRHIKQLSALPYTTFVSDFDNDPFVQQRNLKAVFMEICSADASSDWKGDAVFRSELEDRQRNQQVIACGKWLRKNNAGGLVRDSEMDANAVITVAVLFALNGSGRIVARTAQRDLEQLISQVRESKPDVDAVWNAFLKKIPTEYQPLLRDRMERLRDTIVKKMLGRSKPKTVLAELQDHYIGSEQDIDYD